MVAAVWGLEAARTRWSACSSAIATGRANCQFSMVPVNRDGLRFQRHNVILEKAIQKSEKLIPDLQIRVITRVPNNFINN